MLINVQLRGLKYERMKLRHALFKLEPKKKKVPEYAELESDLDDEFIERWEDSLQEKEIEKAKKKFAKDNEALIADDKEPKEESVLEETIDGIREDFKRLAKERGTNKAELKRAKPIEKIEEQIEALDVKIKNCKIQMNEKEEGKQIALGTR
jgi:DNA topoisomerase I